MFVSLDNSHFQPSSCCLTLTASPLLTELAILCVRHSGTVSSVLRAVHTLFLNPALTLQFFLGPANTLGGCGGGELWEGEGRPLGSVSFFLAVTEGSERMQPYALLCLPGGFCTEC